MGNAIDFVLDPHVPTVVVQRTVVAPRGLVWDMHTKIEHMVRWLGPRGYTMPSCQMDLREGGAWSLVHRDPSGREYRFHGTLRDIVKPERIVRTFVWDGMPDDEVIETLELRERNGKTTITTTGVHASLAARDAFVGAGDMKKGLEEMYERLDELLASLQHRMTASATR